MERGREGGREGGRRERGRKGGKEEEWGGGILRKKGRIEKRREDGGMGERKVGKGERERWRKRKRRKETIDIFSLVGHILHLDHKWDSPMDD